MAVAQGYGKTVTSGSVFAYDVADTRNSYKGEPTTNVFQHYGTEGQGSGADNAVNFNIQGTTGFTRLGYGQNFGDYTIKPGDVVYKYNLGGYGCHYHGNTVSIPSGKYVTFTFDYYVSPGTTIETNLLANLENYGGSALGGNINAPNSLTGVWQTVTTTFGPTGGSGTQAMFLYPGGCGTRFGDTGYILYKNPQVEFLPHKTPFVQTTRSATQGLLPLVGNSTLDLSNVSFDSNAQMTFDGTDDGIIISDSQYNKTNGQPLTVEVVMKPGRNAGQYQDIVVNRSDGAYNWMLYQHSDDGSIQMHGAAQNKSGYIPTIGQYIHVVATITSGQVSTLYINGEVQQVVTGFTYAGMSPSLLCIGVFGTGRYEPYLGTIDIVKIYNRALSAAEVKQNFDFYDARFGIEYDTYYFAVSNRAARYYRRWEADGTEGDISGENMATTTPAYTIYQKPDASFQSPDNYIEVARDDIGTPTRLTEYGVQTSYRNGKWFTSVTVYKGRRGGPLRFEFPNGGTSTYGEEFYKTIVAPYVS